MAVTDTALEWWDRLCTQAGLELRTGRNKPGRDADLEDALRMHLVTEWSPTPRKGDIRLRDLLRTDAKASAPQVTVSHFLETVRTHLRDFACMLADILDTQACAQTHRGADTLRLALRLQDDTVALHTRAQLQAQMDAVRQALDTRIAPADPRRLAAWINEIGGRLIGVLTLPLWKARHVLYPVWTGTRLLRAAREHADRFHFHTQGDTLPFTPGGKRLATYEYDGEQFDIWIELRSALLRGQGKRKRGRYPDFRVVRATLNGNHNDATRFVLECQHRHECDSANAIRAIGDYTQACPDTDILLVYPRPAIAVDMIARAFASRADHFRIITHATAGRERQHPALHDSIRDILFNGARNKAVPSPAFTAIETPPPLPTAAPQVPNALRQDLAATVLLEWTDALQDVDLRLVLINDGKNPQTVAYDHTGSLAEAPYAQLMQDVVTGPGQEVIEISRWGDASYLISVRNFSQTGALSTATVACRIRIQGGTTWVLKPSHPRDYEWTVGTITVVGDEIHMAPYAGETVLSS